MLRENYSSKIQQPSQAGWGGIFLLKDMKKITLKFENNAKKCELIVPRPAWPRHAMAICHAMPNQARSGHSMPRHAMLYHSMPCQEMQGMVIKVVFGKESRRDDIMTQQRQREAETKTEAETKRGRDNGPSAFVGIRQVGGGERFCAWKGE